MKTTREKEENLKNSRNCLTCLLITVLNCAKRWSKIKIYNIIFNFLQTKIQETDVKNIRPLPI